MTTATCFLRPQSKYNQKMKTDGDAAATTGDYTPSYGSCQRLFEEDGWFGRDQRCWIRLTVLRLHDPAQEQDAPRALLANQK
jgi:hypothetical protein